MTPAELARFAARTRTFGLTSAEAVAVFREIAAIPLPPHLEAMLRMAADAVRPGWWMSPKGWRARWRFGRWRAGMRA